MKTFPLVFNLVVLLLATISISAGIPIKGQDLDELINRLQELNRSVKESRSVDSIGGAHLLRSLDNGYHFKKIPLNDGLFSRYAKALDAIGGANLLRQIDPSDMWPDSSVYYVDPIDDDMVDMMSDQIKRGGLDSLGGAHLLKRSVDPLGGGHLINPEYDHKLLIYDYLINLLSPQLDKRTPMDRMIMTGLRKRQFKNQPYKMDSEFEARSPHVFTDRFYKRNFDEIDRYGPDFTF